MTKDSLAASLVMRLLESECPVIWTPHRLLLTASGWCPPPELEWPRLVEGIEGECALPQKDLYMVGGRLVQRGPVRDCDWPSGLLSLIAVRAIRRRDITVTRERVSYSDQITLVRGALNFAELLSLDDRQIHDYIGPWLVKVDGTPCLWQDLNPAERWDVISK